jgi:hypothetical protein
MVIASAEVSVSYRLNTNTLVLESLHRVFIIYKLRHLMWCTWSITSGLHAWQGIIQYPNCINSFLQSLWYTGSHRWKASLASRLAWNSLPDIEESDLNTIWPAKHHQLFYYLFIISMLISMSSPHAPVTSANIVEAMVHCNAAWRASMDLNCLK